MCRHRVETATLHGVPFGFAQGRLSTSFGWRLTSLSMTLTAMRYWVRVFLEHSITFLALGEHERRPSSLRACASISTSMPSGKLQIVPLGGLGEFGMNCMA